MSGFIIELAALNPGASRVAASASAGDLDLPEEWSDPVEAEFQVDRNGDMVAVRGQVRAKARLDCVRCLRTFDQPVEADLTVIADRAGGTRRPHVDDEDDETYRLHDGRQIDLRGDTREALLLELPITPRCREDCRGLCPRCGADLNLEPCTCPRAV